MSNSDSYAQVMQKKCNFLVKVLVKARFLDSKAKYPKSTVLCSKVQLSMCYSGLEIGDGRTT
jgi:hypothetical protein